MASNILIKGLEVQKIRLVFYWKWVTLKERVHAKALNSEGKIIKMELLIISP